MTDYGPRAVRGEGIAVVSLDEALTIDPIRLKPHVHDFFQLFHLAAGARLMHDFRERTVDESGLLFVRPGEVHAVIPAGAEWETVVSFTGEFLHLLPGVSSDPLLDLASFSGEVPWHPLPRGERENTAVILGQMVEEFRASLAGTTEVLRNLLRVLLIRASRSANGRDAPAEPHGLVKAYLLEIERHFRDWQTLEPFARKLAVTANHLNDVVRGETGRPAGHHLRVRRLLEAKRMLLHSELSVSEIAYQLAFKDPSHFARFFRRQAEMSPVEFRHMIREKYRWNPDRHRE